MIKLIELKFNNIGRFNTEQCFNFNNHSKLLLVDGPSGAGKSTIFHALDYLLGINTIPATQLQSRFTKKPCYVMGIFEYKGELLTITRNKKDGLSIQLPNKTISGNSDISEKKLDEIIGISRKLFKKMVHKSQREFGFFLQMTSKQMYEFLVELLGLKIFQDKTILISSNIKQYNEKINNLTITIEQLNKSLDELQILKNKEIKPTCDVTKKEIDELSRLLSQLKKQLKESIDSESEAIKCIPKPIKKIINPDISQIDEIKNNINKLELKKNNIINSVVGERNNITSKLNILKQELSNIKVAESEAKAIGDKIRLTKDNKKHAESSLCPTCKQNWNTQGNRQYIDQINTQIKQLIQDALQKKHIIDKKDSVLNEIEENEKLLLGLQNPDTRNIDQQISAARELLIIEQQKIQNIVQEQEYEFTKQNNIYLEQISKAREVYQSKISELKKQIQQCELELNQNKSKLDNYNVNIENFNNRIQEISTLINDKKLKINENNIELNKLKRKVEIADETKRLIKTYTLQVFQDTLDNIGIIATNILNNIHNMSNASIYFEGCKETKSGTIKDEVNAIINKEGENNIPIKTLSGGERTVVDLAVDLAVIDIIESRAGKGANFFIIDEPFDGLDSEGKEQYLEILKTLDTNKQIILVDHSPELKEMIPDVIRVEK